MLPPGHCLMVRAAARFRARLTDARETLRQEESIADRTGGHFALFVPVPAAEVPSSLTLQVWHYEGGGTSMQQGTVLNLPNPLKNPPLLESTYSNGEDSDARLLFLSTNGRGAMSRARIPWGGLESRYDALLAANLHPHYPVDRQIMLTRCRAWIRYQGYSCALDQSCLETFRHDGDMGEWRFHVPAGQGQEIYLSIRLAMVPNENRLELTFWRDSRNGRPEGLDDDQEVRLILRPDIEDRSFHHQTKAFAGPEIKWPGAVVSDREGLTFSPAADRQLKLSLPKSVYTPEPEWTYMVHRSEDAQRGFDPHGNPWVFLAAAVDRLP
jgi:hypothetical protein